MNDFQFDDFVKKQLSNNTAEVPGHILENVIAAGKKSDPKGFWMFFNRKYFLLASVTLSFIVGGYLFVSQKKSPSTKIPDNIQSTNLTKSKNNIETKVEKIPGNKNEPLANVPTNKSQQILLRITNSNKTVNTKILLASAASSIPKRRASINNSFESITNVEDAILNQPLVQNDKGDKVMVNNNTYYNPVLFPFTFANNKELLNIKKLTSKLDFPKCPTIEENAAGNKKYWEVYAGPDAPLGNYKAAIKDSATNNYLEKRKESSKITSAYSAGLRYTKVFNNAMSVRAGINYSQINEKFKYFNPNELKLVTVITTRVIIRSPGDTLFIKDTLQYQQSGTRIKTTFNHYRNIDIPLVLGYEMGNGRLHANINAGIIINVYSWYKGDVLDTSYQPVSITTGKNSPYQFKNNIGVGFLGAVSFYYKLTDKLHLLIEPYFRYNLSPMSKENLNLQQKYHTAGLRTGLRFDLK